MHLQDFGFPRVRLPTEPEKQDTTSSNFRFKHHTKAEDDSQVVKVVKHEKVAEMAGV